MDSKIYGIGKGKNSHVKFLDAVAKEVSLLYDTSTFSQSELSINTAIKKLKLK